jgi:hypothetical protein
MTSGPESSPAVQAFAPRPMLVVMLWIGYVIWLLILLSIWAWTTM